MRQMTFDQIGTLYNSISNELEGGVTRQNQALLVKQVSTVQTQLQNLIDNGSLNNLNGAGNPDVSVVHAQNIADQMSFLQQQIRNFGTDAFTPKFINDVVRDVQDIVAGDTALSALAQQNNHSGFQQVSFLLTDPTPFPDTPLQTDTLLKFVADSNSLAARAQALAGADPNSADVQQLQKDIHTFSVNADAYSTAQGGLFSARFNNEFNLKGVQGTASQELINGLQTGNADLVNGAAAVLMGNAEDVRGNMLVQGDTFTPAPDGGIPKDIKTVHDAGAVFNDAMTKLIGGVYSGNQTSIVNDLNATKMGLQAAITEEGLTGRPLQNVQKVMNLLDKEAALVGGIDTANPTQVSKVNAQINHDQTQILNIINHDPTLAGLAAGNNGGTPGAAGTNGGTPGFAALPPTHAIHNVGAMANAAPAANAPATAVAATPAANAPAAANATTPTANEAANPAPAVGDHLGAMVDAAMGNLASPPAAMVAAAAGANIPAAANPAPVALSPANPAAADHAALDMAHHSFLDNNHISTAHDHLHHIWG